jgi:hypothetical protein
LPVGCNPVGRNGQGDGQYNNPEESHIINNIKNRAGMKSSPANNYA